MTKLRRICNNCKDSHRCPAGNGRYRIAEDCLFYEEKKEEPQMNKNDLMKTCFYCTHHEVKGAENRCQVTGKINYNATNVIGCQHFEHWRNRLHWTEREEPQPPPDPIRDEFEEAVKEFYLALAETSPGRTALWVLEQAGHGLSKRRGFLEAKAAHEAKRQRQRSAIREAEEEE